METSGYIDAASYIECQQIQIYDGNQNQLYIGPRCSNNWDWIMLGHFSDAYCLTPYTDLDHENVLGLPYQPLSHTYNADGNNCLSCEEYVYKGGENDPANGHRTEMVKTMQMISNKMCEPVYSGAAKFESICGIDAFVQRNQDEQYYRNQVKN
jgi:hypothetical protein